MSPFQPAASTPPPALSEYRFVEAFGEYVDRHIPEELSSDPESARHARMITRFGILGSVFGLIYATFYLAIGHLWGAAIIALCTLGIGLTPALMRWHKSTQLPGNFFSFTLTAGFFGLCLVEGGLHGHAIAWLVSVPLCALLLIGRRAALKWVVISFMTAGFVAGLDLYGIKLPTTYDPRWNSVVSTAGYLGLIVFMFTLGFIFESGRARATARMEEALQKLAASNDQLTHFNKEKNEFLGIAAHDLKNPLTIILANGSLLKVLDDVELCHSHADMIISAAERMHQLINDLLDVAKIEEGRFATQLKNCELNELVEAIIDQNVSAAAAKQIQIHLGLTDDLQVHTDRDAAMQVLDNLVSNAIKYSPLNSTIYIDTLPEMDRVLVCVRDEGPGFSEEDHAKLFKKFSRLSARPTGGESSTGLGLAIAKRLAEALSGSIDCQSEPGAGATFILGLPRGTGKTAHKATVPIPQIPASLPQPSYTASDGPHAPLPSPA